MRDPIPPGLDGPLRRLDEALGQLRTTRIRASRMEIPESEPPDPKELAEVAERPDAPPQLRTLAAAVHDGRASWEQILAMGPAVAVERFEVPPAVARRPAPVEDEEDFADFQVLRRR